MKYARAAILLWSVAACSNDPERPIAPVDPGMTAEIYDATLAEMKRITTPRAGTEVPVNWSERMFLNPMVLLPPADSLDPLAHDSAWTAGAVRRGLVRGVCGQSPAPACPATEPIAFVSLSPPWTLGGDTVFVQAGYAGEAPGEPAYEGVFWIFTLAHDEETGALKVVRKSAPNRVTFENQ